MLVRTCDWVAASSSLRVASAAPTPRIASERSVVMSSLIASATWASTAARCSALRLGMAARACSTRARTVSTGT